MSNPTREQRKYAVVFVFESTLASSTEPLLYEEEIVMFSAESEEDARKKAIAYAKGQTHSYRNGFGEIVNVSMKALVDVQEMIEEPCSGATLYYRHFRDYSAYENFEPLLKGQKL